MAKLRKVELKGFRGSRFPFPIDLGKDCRSIAIFGDNASGKSTVTDAVEWFFYDRVVHLWREDCKEDALRHIALAPNELAEVLLEFDHATLSGSKTIDAGLNRAHSNKSPEFATYLEQSLAERLVLRNAYLQDFILKTKSEKRDEIARIIGYDSIMSFRETIQRVLTWVRGEEAYAAAREGLERCRGRLLKKFSKVPRNNAEYFEIATELVARFKLPKKIADGKSYEECLGALKARITDPKKGEKLGGLNSLKTGLDEFKTSVMQTDKLVQEFMPSYKAVIRNIDKLRSIDLVAFLSKGKDLIEKGRVEKEKCPFCLKPIPDMAHLLEEVTKRIEQLDAAQKEHETLRTNKDSLVKKLRAVSVEGTDRYKQVTGFGIANELGERLEKYKAYTSSLADTIARRFDGFQDVEEAKNHEKHVTELLPAIQAGGAQAEQLIKTLAVTAEEEALMQARDDLILLRENFTEAQHFTKIKAVFETQIRSLSTILDQFIKVQNTVIQDMLDVMSDDISDYYLYLHPNEEVDKIRLHIIGEQGVEFIYSFHGKQVHPPLKYLSESHLNSLGIALFLASVKLLNKGNGFFVLDDVVTSFDINHRLRLLRLLQEKFSEYQIILLTHESFWFEMIKKDMPAASWLFFEVDWSYDRGIEIKRAVKDLKELIEVKRKQGLNVGNDVRKLMEVLLKEVAFGLGVKLPFRFNETNERRDAGELLSEVRGTVNRKSPAIKEDPVWQRLQTCSLIASVASHDPGAEVGKGDIDTILADLGRLEALFLCNGCKGYVSLKKYSQKDKKVYCSCAKKDLDWKD